MRTLPRPKASGRQESTIALINVVFLMLIFFLVAGTLAPPLDPEVTPAQTQEAEPAPPPEALSIRADGSAFYRGAETTLEAYMAGRQDVPAAEPVKVLVDRALPATELIGIADRLRQLGAGSITIITRREAS
ncbi:MAG: ExbD/TolR family protein [Flavobacteriaceae bacterium]